MLALFVVLTGENWVDIYHDALAGNTMGGIFIIIWFAFGAYILLATFAAVILENLSISDVDKLRMQVALYMHELESDPTISDQHTTFKIQDEDFLSPKACNVDRSSENRIEEIAQNAHDAAIEGAEKWMSMQSLSDVSHHGLSEGDFIRRVTREIKDASQKEETNLTESVKETSESFDLDAEGIDEKISYIQRCMKIRDKKYTLVFLNHWITEAFLVFTILISSVFLAIDKTWDPDEDTHEFIRHTEVFFVVIFTLEMVLKCVALGVWGNPHSYLASEWNRLDALCVVISISTLFLHHGHDENIDGGMGRALRCVRTLRPLRMINKDERIRRVFDAVKKAFPVILVVAILSVFTMFIFSILGMTLFSGKFTKCNYDSAAGAQDCLGTFNRGYVQPKVWSNPSRHFDNIYEAMFTVFTLSAVEGWLEVLYCATDVTSKESQSS